MPSASFSDSHLAYVGTNPISIGVSLSLMSRLCAFVETFRRVKPYLKAKAMTEAQIVSFDSSSDRDKLTTFPHLTWQCGNSDSLSVATLIHSASENSVRKTLWGWMSDFYAARPK